jgi:hypothetical protein
VPIKSYDLQIDQGATLAPPPFQYLVQGSTPPAAIVDVTGYVAEAYIGYQPLPPNGPGTNALIALSSVSSSVQGEIAIDGPMGTFSLTATPEATALLPSGTGALSWSLWITSSTGVESLLVAGQALVFPPGG